MYFPPWISFYIFIHWSTRKMFLKAYEETSFVVIKWVRVCVWVGCMKILKITHNFRVGTPQTNKRKQTFRFHPIYRSHTPHPFSVSEGTEIVICLFIWVVGFTTHSPLHTNTLAHTHRVKMIKIWCALIVWFRYRYSYLCMEYWLHACMYLGKSIASMNWSISSVISTFTKNIRLIYDKTGA